MKTLLFILTCLYSAATFATGVTPADGKTAIAYFKGAIGLSKKLLKNMDDQITHMQHMERSVKAMGTKYIDQYEADHAKHGRLHTEQVAMSGHIAANTLSIDQAHLVCEWLLATRNISPADAADLTKVMTFAKDLKDVMWAKTQQFIQCTSSAMNAARNVVGGAENAAATPDMPFA